MRHYAASVGIPSGRSFPPFFGMYTRRTGSARPGPPWRCSRIARLARSSEVKATCLSTPGVRRPALCCVTRRTLTSVLARLRSSSFCRLRTCFRLPSCSALKIRSSVQFAVPAPPGAASRWRPSQDRAPCSRSPRCRRPRVERSRLSHPAPRRPTCPYGSSVPLALIRQRATRLTSAPFRGPRHETWMRPVIRERPHLEWPGHALLFFCCLSAAAICFLAVLSPQVSASLTVRLSARYSR